MSSDIWGVLCRKLLGQVCLVRLERFNARPDEDTRSCPRQSSSRLSLLFVAVSSNQGRLAADPGAFLMTRTGGSGVAAVCRMLIVSLTKASWSPRSPDDDDCHPPPTCGLQHRAPSEFPVYFTGSCFTFRLHSSSSSRFSRSQSSSLPFHIPCSRPSSSVYSCFLSISSSARRQTHCTRRWRRRRRGFDAN